MDPFVQEILANIAIPLGLPIFTLTVILAFLSCRHRIAVKKPVSYWAISL